MPPREAVARQARLKMGPWLRGMDQKTTPDRLREGKCAYAQNVELDETTDAVVTRQGSIVLSTLPSGLSPRDAYVFVKSDGTQYLLVSDGVTLYWSVDPTVQANWTSLFTGFTSTGFLEFETAEDKVWMCNGIQAPMSWDGTTLITYDRTYTNTTDASAVSANGGAGGNATLTHAGLTGATDYWKNMKLVFTSGANIGLTVSVNAYDSAGTKLTFNQAIAGIATTDRWVLGIQMPVPKYLRFWNDNLFLLCTTANNSEARFNRRFDPNTGTYINIDHPLAWPSSYQLSIYSQDGDQIWCASPVMRDRFLIAKATGLFRLERDPQTIYRVEVITRFIGSRFHRSWVEKNGLLYFLGQSKDGYPDVYKTDMLQAEPADEEGGLEPTLRALRQPNSIQRAATITSPTDLNAGTLSSNVKTSGSKLEISPTIPALISNSNIEIKSQLGLQPYAGLLGNPTWDVMYEPATTPDLATPAWVAGSPGSVSGGVLNVARYSRSSVLDSSKNAIMSIRANLGDSAGTGLNFGLANGAFAVWFALVAQSADNWVYVLNGIGTSGITINNSTDFYPKSLNTFTLQLLANGQYFLWVNGVLWKSGTAVAATANRVFFGNQSPTNTIGSDGIVGWITSVDDNTNCKFSYYSVDSTSGVPNPISNNGVFVSQYDYSRAPDALRRIFTNYLSNKFITPCGTTAASVTIQLNAGTDMTQFSAGQVLDFLTVSTRSPIANGRSRTIQSVDSANHRITIDGGGGNITTDATVGVYLQGGSLSVKTWSSDTVDFTGGTDPAGYVAVAQGVATTSLVKRYLRIQVTLAALDTAHSPQINALYAGMLWVSAPIFIGSNIAGWGAFVDVVLKPAGTDQTIKMRYATVGTVPVEGDWSAWVAVANGDNIGTDLADGSPPTSRWVQLKVEEGPSSSGDYPTTASLPTVTSMILNWSEGATKNLPVGAVIRKKRYLLCAASSTSQSNDTVVVNNRNDAWVLYSGWKLNAMLHFRSFFLGMSAVDSKILQLDVDNVYNDQGVAIDAYVDSQEDSFGDDYELRKNVRYGYLHTGRSAFTLLTSYKRPGDTDFGNIVSMSIPGDGREVRQTFPIGTSCKRLQRRYRCSTLNQKMNFLGETVYYDRRAGTP